jgi:hypothetical protein
MLWPHRFPGLHRGKTGSERTPNPPHNSGGLRSLILPFEVDGTPTVQPAMGSISARLP